VCRSCGTPLPAAHAKGAKTAEGGSGPAKGPVQGSSQSKQQEGVVAPDDVSKKLRMDYAFGRKEQMDRELEAVMSLFDMARNSRMSTKELLQEAAKTIYHQFRIREVTIGLLDIDGFYKYSAMYGVRPEVWHAHFELTYTYDDFFDPKRWKGTSISHFSKLFLAENTPYEDGEESTYDKMLMLKSKRKNDTDSIEGDYLDIHVFGPDNSLLGWIEVSGTWDGKIPDARILRWLEIVASVIGVGIALRSKAERHAAAVKTPKLH